MRFKNNREKRHFRVRKTITGTDTKPRLAVFRSNKYVFVQIIDDVKRVTLVSCSSKNIKNVKGSKMILAKEAGKDVAQKALKANITEVIFDRGGYKYHGRVKSVAEGAREAGLKF